jgi:hypothetical protein
VTPFSAFQRIRSGCCTVAAPFLLYVLLSRG